VTPRIASGGFEHSILLESNVQLDERNSLFGRVEWVQKNAEELVVAGFAPDTRFDVGNIVVGYIREVAKYGGASLGVGIRGSVGFVPEALDPTYGTRTPAGIAIYVRLRPAMLLQSELMDHEEKRQHHMPMHSLHRTVPADSLTGGEQ
jgi:hypothetical protein